MKPADNKLNALSVRNLSVSVPARGGRVLAVDNISFDLPIGKKIGVVGESGSGKSLTALALMRLIKEPVQVDAGEIFMDGKDILKLSAKEFFPFRGGEIAMIYQDPMSALNQIMRIGEQIIESIRVHSPMSKQAARKIAIDQLGSVGIPEPEKRIDSYPFEMSGGMLQRVVIAIALSGNAKVLIADEATTALDVSTQERVLTLIDKIAAERGLSVLLITHDLGVAAQYADEILVMYAGRIVEHGQVQQVFSRPVHPFTRALLDSKCDYTLDVTKPIRSIAGQPPRPDNRPSGCVFAPRCDFAEPACSASNPLLSAHGDAMAACFRADELIFNQEVR
jgi:oligopeptide/dipeptide ABC transporter ATP-binding protein